MTFTCARCGGAFDVDREWLDNAVSEAHEMGYEDPMASYKSGRLLIVCAECYEDEIGAKDD